MQELVDEVNRDRVRVEQIKRFAILPREFSQEEGEVTPTLKLRRRVIHDHFADEIEQLYAELLAEDALRAVVLAAYQPVRLSMLTTAPVCGAWMNSSLPM